MNRNLSAVVRIKTMARSAAQTDVNTPDLGGELGATYERLRLEAKALATRAGWSADDSFDRELPPLGHEAAVRQLPRGMASNQPMLDAIAAGQRAKILLGQLAAWAEGYQEAFEIEAQLKANAEAKVEAAREEAKAASKRPPGFSAP